MTTQPLPREETESVLQEILAAPPFGQEDWAQSLAQRLGDWYRDTVGELAISSPILFWTAIAMLSVVLVFLLWHIGISLRAVWQAVRSDEASLTARPETMRDSSLGHARAAMARGEYRRAVELAWAAVAAAREETDARTPRQQARLLAEHLAVPLRPHLQELLSMHEHACYAGVATSPALAHAALERAAMLTESERHA